MNLTSQRRLAADLLKVGTTRVWIDPEEEETVSSAITRNEVRKLIHEGAIKRLPQTGVSRGRKRLRRQEITAGRHQGEGSIKGSRGPEKTRWIIHVRAIRRRLRSLRDGHQITTATYRNLSLMAKGGGLRNVAHLNEYLEARKLVRRR